MLVLENSCESLGLQGDPTSPSWRRSVLDIYWKDWCWSWNSNTLATWCKELTHWKRHWYWERLKAGGKGDDRGWDGWMASLKWAPGVGNGQGSLACCSPWGCKESDTTEWLKWTELNQSILTFYYCWRLLSVKGSISVSLNLHFVYLLCNNICFIHFLCLEFFLIIHLLLKLSLCYLEMWYL